MHIREWGMILQQYLIKLEDRCRTWQLAFTQSILKTFKQSSHNRIILIFIYTHIFFDPKEYFFKHLTWPRFPAHVSQWSGEDDCSKTPMPEVQDLTYDDYPLDRSPHWDISDRWARWIHPDCKSFLRVRSLEVSTTNLQVYILGVLTSWLPFLISPNLLVQIMSSYLGGSS